LFRSTVQRRLSRVRSNSRPCGASSSAIALVDTTSLSLSPTHIADYAEPAGAVRTKAAKISHNQPGNPDRLAEVVAFLDQPNPPVRLPLGSDTVAAIEAKHARRRLLARWRSVSA
jgi:hypothetical protein